MFKNPIAPRIKESKEKNPWNFQAPCYDERCMVSAGDSYGVGFNQPIGHKGNPKESTPMLPKGRVKTMQDDNMSESTLEMYGKNKNSAY
jgi:hypothetical protein